MEKIKKYQKAILSVLKSYQSTSTTVETLPIIDTEHQHYQIVEAGWQDADHYHYGLLFHIHIKETGKIVILENNTEDDIAEFLIAAGVSKADIIINFVPERIRQYTGYAVA
jgi:XisI protein